MISNTEMNILSKILKNSLLEIKEKNIEEYIQKLKSNLFFIGKIVTASFYFKSKVIDKQKYEKIIHNNENESLPDIFKRLENTYNIKEDIDNKVKNEIIGIITNLTVKQLQKFSLGVLYEYMITEKERKYLGQVYTPDDIVKHMVSIGIKEEDIIENPYFKVIDPACGGGYFLVEAYERIEEIFTKKYELIILKHPKIQKELDKGIHQFIVKNNLYGVDLDEFAVFMTTVTLLLKQKNGLSVKLNIFQGDVLLEDLFELIPQFQLIIANPPYIGHKKIDKEYRKLLEDKYQDVYLDKSDISYCFFKKGFDLLTQKGKLLFITSRYFLEAPSAKNLRKFIDNNFSINKIFDFYGAKVFKGAKISPVIIQCDKSELKNNNVHIYRLKDNVKIRKKILDFENELLFDNFDIKQSKFDDTGWILLNKQERRIYKKIYDVGEVYLDEVCEFNQGIITGCDKAFVVDEETIKKENLEKNIIKPWVKNSNIDRYEEPVVKKFILYTDQIEDIHDYKNTIKHIEPYIEKLNKRRECVKGTRKWYQLQWGRKLDVFEKPKILFPFKAERNRFTIDRNNLLCSADVYIINIKDEYKDKISLEYLVALLNSNVFEFYFKSMAKKVGDRLYEYYPNKLVNLKIKITDKEQKLKDMVEKKELEDINKYYYKLYDLNKEEIKIIENRIYYTSS